MGLSIKIGGYYRFFQDGEWDKTLYKLTHISRTNLGGWFHFKSDDGKEFCYHGSHVDSYGKARLIERCS